MSESSTGKIVHFIMDPDHPPLLTAEDRTQLDHLATMQDTDVDFSDIPKQTDFTGWTRPGRMQDMIAARMTKHGEGDITGPEGQPIRIQADVFSFLQERGEASEEKINEVLRQYVETQRKTA